MSDLEIDPSLGEKILENVLNKPKNISIFNKAIIKISRNLEEYKSLLYNISYQLKNREVTTRDHREIFEDIKNKNVGWDSHIYKDFKKSQDEKDEFLNNPIQVVEGVNQCQKCGSKKTFSYTKQMRCADEGTTVFCICVQCSHRWKFG